MVRGPAALLAPYGAALAYFLLVPALPAIGDVDAATFVSAGIGLVLLGCCVLALLPAHDEPAGLVLLALGGALLSAALTEAGALAPANVAKALFAGAFGMLLAWRLGAPAIVVAIALFVAGIDVWSVATGPTSTLVREQPAALDFLTLELPEWGDGGSSQLGISDLIFLGFFAASAWRLGLRRRVTAATLLGGLLAGLVLGLALDRAVPLLPPLAAALLLPNLDLLARMLREEAAG